MSDNDEAKGKGVVTVLVVYRFVLEAQELCHLQLLIQQGDRGGGVRV